MIDNIKLIIEKSKLQIVELQKSKHLDFTLLLQKVEKDIEAMERLLIDPQIIKYDRLESELKNLNREIELMDILEGKSENYLFYKYQLEDLIKAGAPETEIKEMEALYNNAQGELFIEIYKGETEKARSISKVLDNKTLKFFNSLNSNQ